MAEYPSRVMVGWWYAQELLSMKAAVLARCRHRIHSRCPD